MSDRAVTLLVVLVVIGATAPLGALATPDGGEQITGAVAGQPETDTENTTVGFGASVSAFVQTSAADAEGEVNDGVFSARFEEASNETRESLVQERTDRLADRIDRLRDERAVLLNTTRNLTVAERAQAARLAARIDSLQATLNVTADAARTAGVNETRLTTLREQANELSGPEVAERARGLAGGPDRSDRGNGPPADVPGNRTDGPGEGPPEEAPSNRTDGDRDQGNGPPDDRGQGNESDDGAAPGDGNGAPGSDRGEGNDSSSEDAGERGGQSDGDRGQGNDADGGDNSGEGNGPPDGDRGRGNDYELSADGR